MNVYIALISFYHLSYLIIYFERNPTHFGTTIIYIQQIMPHSLQPHPKTPPIFLLTLLLLSPLASPFTYTAVSVSVDNSHVGATATYTFSLLRMYDDLLNTTPWASTPLATSDTATVVFPAQYGSANVAGATCIDVSISGSPVTGVTCSVSGLTVTISNAFASTSLVSDMMIILGGIVNPGSAVTTSPFVTTIGSDSSSATTAAELTLTPGLLTSLTITFQGQYVNTTSDMVLNFVPSNAIPQNGGVKVVFPSALTWARELSPSHTIPLNGTLTCYGVSSNVDNATIGCSGLFATQTITITNAFSTIIAAGTTVSLAIKGLFSPPTTEPADQLTVTTCDSTLTSIDSQIGSISGLLPQVLTSFTMGSSLAGPMYVNSLGGLTFSFTLPDTLSNADSILITFPSGTLITYLTTASTIPIQTTTYYSTNTTLVMTQRSTNADYPAGTASTITFIRYRASPSTRVTGAITMTMFTAGYSKMSASATISAVAKNYSLAMSASSTTVNAYTSYSATFSMIDALSASGYIDLILDPKLCITTAQINTIQTNLTITVSGSSIKTNPSTQIIQTTVNNITTYLLRITNLNTTATSIPIQTVTVSIANLLNPPAVTTLTSFSLSTYYTNSDLDLVASANFTGSVGLTTGSVTIGSAGFSVATTYTFGVLSVVFVNQNPVEANGFITVVLPTQLKLLSVCVGSLLVNSTTFTSTVTYDLTLNKITFKIAALLPASSSVTFQLTNILSPNSTQPTSSFTITTSDSLAAAIDANTNSVGVTVGQGNTFNLLTLTRSSTVNSQQANYTLTFEQTQNSSDVSDVTIVLNSALVVSSVSKVYQIDSSGTETVLSYTISGSTIQTTVNSQTSTTYKIMLSTILNPPSTQPLTSPFTLTTYTSNRSFVFSSQTGADIVNTAPSPILVNTFSFSNLAYGEATNLSLNLTQPTGFSTAVHKIVVDVPTSFGMGSVTCSGTGVGCALAGSTVTATMTNASFFSNPILFSIDALISPSITTSTAQIFTIATFDSLGYIAQTDSSTVLFQNNCTLPCRTCSSTTPSSCLSCYSAPTTNLTLLYQSSCYDLCPSSSYLANSTHCVACDTSCLTCDLSAANCTSCNVSAGLPLLYINGSNSSDGNCLAACAVGTYENNGSVCLDCNSTCAQCNSSTVCTVCVSGLFLFENSCISACPNTTLTDTTNMTCTLCSSLCLTCQTTVSTCTSCHPFTFLSNTTCASTCPASNMFVNANQTCQNCNSQCLTCLYEAGNCTGCVVGSNLSYLLGNSCVGSCPVLYYSNASTLVCQLCTTLGIGCANCSSENSCFTCDPGFLLFPANSSCLSTVPDGYVDLNGTLTPCDSTCFTCLNSTSTCTSCTGNLSLYLTACVSACPANQTVSVSNICQSCLYPCLTCVNATSTCLSCFSNSSLFLSVTSCVTALNCPNGTYANTSTNVCQNCDISCLTCTNTANNCSLCASGFYLDTASNTCYNVCPSGLVGIGSVCENCTTPCAACSVSQTNCTGCAVSTPALYLDGNSCVEGQLCPSGTYANSTTLICQSCSSPCLTCTSSAVCTTCANSTFLSGSSCVSAASCPSGTVAGTNSSTNLSECLSCDATCLTCTNTTTTCSACNVSQSLYLSGSACVTAQSCSNSTYANSTTAVCQNCPSPCSTCISSTICSSCIIGYSLLADSSCSNVCPTSTYNATSSGIYQCLPCSALCSTCDITSTNCTSCGNNTYLSVNSCLNATSCPADTYPNSTTNICETCNPPCASCTSSTFCLTCLASLYYQPNTGVCVSNTSCPNGTIPVNSSGLLQCLACDASCFTCSGSVASCTGCSNGLYLDGSSCVNASACPNGTFAQNSTNLCASCPTQCSACSSLVSCSSCSGSLLFFNNFCYSSCPNTSIAINSTCVVCSSPCLTCSGAVGTCTSCLQNTTTALYLSNNVCVTASNCGNGTTAVNTTFTCQSCQTGCSACSGTVSNCSSCTTGYFLDPTASICATTCPSGYFPDSATLTCLICNTSCATCTNASSLACVSCTAPLVLTNNQCLATCPTTAPFNVSNICVSCSTAISGCITCNTSLSTPYCLGCGSTLLLFNQSCLSACPTGYKNNGAGGCQVDNTLDGTLTGSLTIGGVFPLPFTITGSIIFIACFMSKLQNRNTYITGVAYALWGIIQTVCLAYTILNYDNSANYKNILIIGIFIIVGLNMIGLVIQSCLLAKDQKFSKWLGTPFNCGFYGLVVIVSAVSSYKFKLIVFTKLFSFKCVRAQLEHVQKFRLFNFLSFLGVGHQGIVLYASALIIITLSPNTTEFLQFLDLIIVNILNVVLALAASSKSQTFFEQQEEDGFKINKIYNIYDEEYINKVDDTISNKNKKPEFESRDNLLDEDDQFTLSISDRNDEDFPHGHSDQLIVPTPAANKINKSTVWEQPFESQSILRRDNQTASGNMSAIYSAELSKSRRKKLQMQPQVVLVPHEEKSHHSQENLSERPNQKQAVKDESNRNIFQPQPQPQHEPQNGPYNELELEQKVDEAEQIELPQQDIIVAFGDTPKTKMEETPLKQQSNAKVQYPEEDDLQQIQIKPNDKTQPQPLTVTERQAKIYKGNLPNNFDEDIDEIDLALSKKQRQLIEIRKSIRKRQNSNQKRSQRHRSRSRGKMTKAGQSQKGATMTEFNFKDKQSAKPQVNVKPVERAPMVVTSNANEQIVEELEAPPGSVQPQHKPVTVHQEQHHIPQEQMEHHPVTPAVKASPIKDESRSPGKFYQPPKAFRVDQIGHEYQQQPEEIDVQKMMKKVKEQDDIQENLPKHKNIFDDRKDSSFVSEQKSLQDSKLVGLKAPKSKHTKKSIKQDDNIFTKSPLNLKIEAQPDEQNQPLRSKSKNKSRGWQGQAMGQDALEDLIEKTQRANVAPHRSHLLRGQPQKPADPGQYNQLEEVSTVRQPSVGDLASKKSYVKPPLQNRPTTMQNRPTTSKNRMYMAGLQQIQSHRANSRQKQHEDIHNKTAYERSFYEPKSKELARNEDSIDMYPSSFSTNRIPLQGDYEPSDEPRKPTIHSRVSQRDKKPTLPHEQDEHSLESSFAKKSMKSYRSRSIERQQAEKRVPSRQKERQNNDDLKEYYGRREKSREKSRSKSRSRSRSRDGNRSSDKKLNELEKIYLQRLEYKK